MVIPFDSDLELSKSELLRYSRQILLPEFGISGQKLLKSSSVLCIGSGGLGSTVLTYLASAGIGRIGIVDFDIVDLSNLHRQIIHSTESIGQDKTLSAKDRIQKINPNCKVEIHTMKLDKSNATETIKSYQYICDCSDNFPSRYLVNDVCVLLGKPFVYGAVFQFEGQASVFNVTPDSPNYRDLVPTPPSPGLIPSCAESGVIGVLPGLIGIVQATEIIKLITGLGSLLDGRILVFDALKMSFKELKLQPIESNSRVQNLVEDPTSMIENNPFIDIQSISVEHLNQLLLNDNSNLLLLDVRTNSERELSLIENSISVPLSSILDGSKIQFLKDLIRDKKLVVYCKKGSRSLQAICELKKFNITAINLEGGIDAWAEKIDKSLLRY